MKEKENVLPAEPIFISSAIVSFLWAPMIMKRGVNGRQVMMCWVNGLITAVDGPDPLTYSTGRGSLQAIKGLPGDLFLSFTSRAPLLISPAAARNTNVDYDGPDEIKCD
jgi:hypothetical protein